MKENYIAGIQQRPGGRNARMLVMDTSAVANTAGDLTNLISYTLPAGLLRDDGDMLEIEASVTLANDTDLKLSVLTFGSTTVATRSGAADQNLPRFLRATVIRTGAATQIAAGLVHTQGQASNVTNSAPSETLSGTVAIVLKGQNQTDVTSPSVTSRYLRVTYYPSNNS